MTNTPKNLPISYRPARQRNLRARGQAASRGLAGLALAAAALWLAAPAQALTVTSSFGNALAPLEIHQSASLGLFNSNLGTLTNVQMGFTGLLLTDINLVNGGAGAAQMNGTASESIFFTSNLAALSALFAHPMISLFATTGLQTVDTGSHLFAGLHDAVTVNWDAQLDGIFASLSQAGGGSFALDCTSSTRFSLSSNIGNSAGGGLGNAQSGCGAEVTYTYDPLVVLPPLANGVPEPTSLALMGAALAALVARRQPSLRLKVGTTLD